MVALRSINDSDRRPVSGWQSGWTLWSPLRGQRWI